MDNNLRDDVALQVFLILCGNDEARIRIAQSYDSGREGDEGMNAYIARVTAQASVAYANALMKAIGKE